MQIGCPAVGEIAQCVPPDSIALQGVSPVIERLREVARTLAGTNLPVVIVGEPGSGTDALAHAIHLQSPHADGQFMIVACDAPGSSLIADMTDWCESPFAQPGTVVLDRIYELSHNAQAALMKMLASPERSGGARLLVCTDRELDDEVRRGHMREDLARYLGQLFIRMPALRQRRQDIAHLADFMAERYAAMFGRPRPALTPQLRRVLEESLWPGNIRELDAAMKMIVLVGDERVSIAALRSASKDEKGPFAGPIPLKEAARAASRAAEREVIQKVLSRSGGNRKLAASRLQISYKALLYKLKQFGLSTNANRENA